MIRKHKATTKWDRLKWDWINRISIFCLVAYAFMKILLDFRVEIILDKFYLFAEAMFLYHLFQYIIKVIYIIKIKADCLS